jgi:uncharacterized membrane protein YfcA
MWQFPISGVETYWWLPPLFAFVISCLSSVAGLSGAFLLLPFQISYLGFVGPGVSPTNLFYNIVSIPSGVVRYSRERRMIWALAWAIVVGSLPGMFLGAVIRIKYLPDPHDFKPFAGAVLLFIAVRMIRSVMKPGKPAESGNDTTFKVDNAQFGLKRIAYRFNGTDYEASSAGIMILSFLVGIIGGTYGIGGGAIVAPFLVAYYGLPIHTIAGATLFSTFVTSVFGVGFYWLLSEIGFADGTNVTPDWMLGGLFGLGGAAGMYVGARLQRKLPARLIKIILTLLLLAVSVRYLFEAL